MIVPLLIHLEGSEASMRGPDTAIELKSGMTLTIGPAPRVMLTGMYVYVNSQHLWQSDASHPLGLVEGTQAYYDMPEWPVGKTQTGPLSVA